MKKITITLILFTISFLLFSATGRIAGKITRSDNGKPIADVAIFVEGGETGVYTKPNGTFILENVEEGTVTLHVQHISFHKQTAQTEIKANETSVKNFVLIVKSIEISGLTVSANRAKSRETPVAFTDIDQEELLKKYTTGDIPDLLSNIPGLFATTSGLGEAEITMRGFDAQKIQILVNGIPVNDPESQVVYWSNWTGLTSNAKSVQVQRGAGASLYGSGAFGGSVNIETMGSANDQEFTIRTSAGYYTTDGKSATEKGVMENYDPINYNLLLKYSSGKLYNDKFKFDLSAERKAGDYYIRGTEYDGWSFGFETEHKLSKHVLNTSFIIAPQKHNQARSTYDRELGKFLGREFNFTNHKWQENKYIKPQFSIRDRWAFSPKSYLMTNLFFTTGEGGGSYANNIIFDAESGALLYKSLKTETSERRNFARYAHYVYEQTGYLVDGFEIEDMGTWYSGTYTWAGDSMVINGGSNFLNSDSDHTWKMTSYNNHVQVGLNSYYNQDVTDNLNITIGTEGRYWKADHYKEGTEFRHYNPIDADSVSTFDAFMRIYDYTTTVFNTSGFARAKVNIPFDSGIQSINLMLDGQYAVYYSEIEENEIKFYDFNRQEFIDEGYYISKTDSIDVWIYDSSGDSTEVRVLKFEDDDYKRTYDFFSPKFGVNVNLDDNWNILANYSIVYKEPKARDWYDKDIGSNQEGGPGIKQSDAYGNILYDIVPEKGETIEGGFSFKNKNIKIDATYYHTKYTDKIEQAEIGQVGQTNTATLNVGEAHHQGMELSVKGNFGYFDYNASTTFSKNRWKDLNDKYQEIFYEDAEDVEGKVVPFSPEQMANAGIGYTFQNMPLYGNLRIGLNAKWSDEMYSTYDNVYCKQLYYYDDNGNFQSIGEHHFIENPLGEGEYSYNEDTDEYELNSGGDFDREWILSSSKLPVFFELNGSMSYCFYIGNHEASIKLNVNNMLNRTDNYSKAYISKAYAMKLKQVDENGDISWDPPVFGEAAPDGNGEGGGYYPYLSPSPLMNIFITMEYKF